MSPTAFKQQIDKLIQDLSYCYELCVSVRTNRRLGPKTEALDRLQYGLQSSAKEIQVEFNTLRKVNGSRMDLGDELSRTSLTRCIRKIQDEVQPRLSDIAHKRRATENPRFGELFQIVEKVEEKATQTLESLSLRLETTMPAPQALGWKPLSEPKYDEVMIKSKERDYLVGHMKNSWVERLVEGRILYVNVFDDKLGQWERPDGYIKMLPRTTSGMPLRMVNGEGEEPRIRPTRDSWNNGKGW